jgi:hypothetical protein
MAETSINAFSIATGQNNGLFQRRANGTRTATAACSDGKLMMPSTAARSIVFSVLCRSASTMSAVVRPSVGK